MEESKTEYHTDARNEEARQKMLNLIAMPIRAQRFYYFNEMVPKHYNAEVIAEKEDRISLIRGTYKLQWGNNGCFIKRDRAKSGITYHKTGRSSQRLRVWGKDSVKHDPVIWDMVKTLANKLDVAGKELFNSSVIQYQGTQGMYGYIFAENITNMTEAMQYHIRYSLRGTGIRQDLADNLYKYYDRVTDPHRAKSALFVALNPNRFLEQFQDAEDMAPICKVIENSGQRLIRMALCTGEKVDWADRGFDPEEEAERLQRKGERIEELLQLWEGGPVLRKPHSLVNNFTNASNMGMRMRMGGAVVVQDPAKVTSLVMKDILTL